MRKRRNERRTHILTGKSSVIKPKGTKTRTLERRSSKTVLRSKSGKMCYSLEEEKVLHNIFAPIRTDVIVYLGYKGTE